MSKIIDMAIAIDKELSDLQTEIANANCRVYQLEEQLAYQKTKNRDVAAMLRELASRIEREEI